MSPMMQVRATLVEQERWGAARHLQLHAPLMAQQLHPGQAVLIQAGITRDPFLRRTFYPVAIDETSWSIRLPPSADAGMAWLRTLSPGAQLDCLGPVGKGFSLGEKPGRLLCLGVGEQAWVLLPLIQQAVHRGWETTLAIEATTRRQVIPGHHLPVAVEYHVMTRDGSAGQQGDLAHLLPRLLAWADQVMAVGPRPFYRRLARHIEDVRFRLSPGYAQALYLADFFCGFGACQACATDVAGGRRRVCINGPVFDLAELLRIK